MTLVEGARLGPYSILGPLGAGGMGEVYRARDPRLGRDVAVKVLRGDRAATEEARHRFDREARAISQLSHPNVCTLHDVGRDGETSYLVMELLEGETLADRLSRGAIALEQVARIGIETCSALAAAHERGLVHRDLKPGNVMLTPNGVKLLDFGLAKLLESRASGAPRTDLPTERASPRTAEGDLVGTLQYMAPEQLEGRPVDARTDIFALGAILFEMATGRRAFNGTSHTSLITSILTSEPPVVSSLQRLSPPELDRLVKTCLAKDPAARWTSARDVALLLQGLQECLASAKPASRPAERPGPEAPGSSAPSVARRRAAVLPWLVATISAGAACALLLSRPDPGPRGGPIRFQIPPPEGGAFAFNLETTFLSFSPDGSDLAYIASDAEGARRIYHRPLATREARPLPGTEGAVSLFFSADGRSIGFFTADRLGRLDLPGGTAVTICQIPAGSLVSGTWSRTGDILFGGPQRDAIYRVPASGGPLVKAVSLDPARGEGRVMHPMFLPDGERFLYVSWSSNIKGELRLFEPGSATRALGPMSSLVQLARPDVVVFAKDGALVGQKLDPRAGRLVGPPFAIAERVRYFQSTGAAAFGTSLAGTVAYQPQGDVNRLTWFDRSGRELGTVGPAGGYLRARLSPDGKRALVDHRRPDIGTFDIWMLELALGTETRLTTEPETEVFPVWAPAGTVVYSDSRSGPPRLARHDLTTRKAAPLLPAGRGFQVAQDVSPDGRFLAYTERAGGTFDLFAVPLDGGEPVPLVTLSFEESNAQFSPDGRFLAFTSTESGRSEAYVMPFPGPGERTRVSTGGADSLRWVRDELLYISGDQRLTTLPIRTSPTLEVGAPSTLFTLPGKGWSGFDVTADGSRFLANARHIVANELPLEVVVNAVEAAR